MSPQQAQKFVLPAIGAAFALFLAVLYYFYGFGAKKVALSD
jgi:hypothetical protein